MLSFKVQNMAFLKVRATDENLQIKSNQIYLTKDHKAT